MQCVHTLLKLAQLGCKDHGTRMPDERLPKKILCGELQVRTLPWWSEEAIQRYPQSLPYLKEFNIPTESWEQIAQDNKFSLYNSVTLNQESFSANKRKLLALVKLVKQTRFGWQFH